MEPMEIEQLLVLKNLAQDVRHFLLRQKNEADKCLEDFDETHNKLKLTNKLTTIFCELNAFSISHAEALKTRITDFGEEDEFNASIKRLEELVSNGNNETSPVKPDPTSSDESLVLKLSQSSSVHPAENLSQATCEYSIESEGLIQPIVDSPSILERIDALDTTITTINSEPVEILNLDANISAQFSEEDFDITGLISYNKVPQGSSVDGDKGKQINTSSADENNTNVEEINSSTTTAEVSSVSAVEQVSSDTIDQDKAKQSDINEDVATQVSSSTDKSIYGVNESIIDVSIDQGNAKLPSGADESDNEVEMDAIVQDSNVSNDVGKAKLPSGADKSDSDADYDAETQVSSVSDTKSPANVDQLNAKLPSVADENDLDEDSDVATQVTSVSDAQGNVKLPSGADESDSEADFDAATQVSSISDVKPPADVDDQLNAAQATSVSAKLPFGANESYSDADFDAATEISSVSDARGNTKLPSGADESDSDADLDADTSKQDKLPSTANDAVTENQSLLKEQLRQEAVDNDGDISASDSSNEAPQAIVKTKMDIFKEISEFVKKKKEEGQSNGSSDAKEKEDDLSTKKKRKRKKKFKSKARVSTTENSNSNENNLDITNKVVSDDIISKTHNGETRESQPITRLEDTDTDKTEISDTEPNQKVISPFKKKIIKPLPETSSDSDGILLKKKATALPVSSSNYEDSEPGRGTKRQFSTSDDSESMPPKKVSAAIDDDEDPVQDIQRHSNTPEDSITSDDVVASSKRKISESSTHSYQFNLDEQASDSLCELSNSNKKNKSTEEEPSAELQLNIEDRDNLLSMLDDKEQEEARNNQDQLLNLPNAERDELLDLLNQGERVSEVDESSDNNDAENGHLSDSLLSDEDAPKASPPNKFSLDNQGRDELLDLLTEKYQDCQIEDDKQGTKTKGVNRDMLLEILNEFMQINSNSQDVKTEIMNVDGMELDCNREPDLDAGSDSNSVFLDVVREEIAEQDYKKPTENPEETDEDQAAWDAFHDLNKDDDEFISSSSSSTSIDTDIDDDLDIDFSDQERREEEKKNIDKIKQDFNINKELYVKVEKTDFSDYTNKVKKRTTGKTDEDDRLCDISNVLKKNTKSKLVRNKPTLQDHSGSRSSSSNRSDSSRLNNSLSVGYDSDNDTYISDNDVPLSNEDQSDDDQSNDERYHTLLIDNIFNSSDDEQSKNDSDDEVSSDEEKIRKKVLTRKNKKKKDIDTSGSEKEDATEVKESAELDSSDEEDFVGTRKERKTWRNDPLLISSDTDDEHSKKKLKKRNKIQENGWNDTSTSDSSSVHETPDKTVISSEDSDGDCKVLDKTPLKPIIITDDDESSSKKNKGRRNLKPLVEDDALAISTQVANNEERARIKRLQERDKEKEIYANNTCNIEEEDPLILDSYKGTEIRVHPKITVKLKPHQREGIQFMWDSCYESIKQMEKGWEGSGCILAHCMGLGKTLQALALIQTLFTCDITKIKHVLVVCPLSTVSNWRNEHKLAYQNIRNSHVRFYAIQNDGNDRFRIVQNWYKTGGMLVLGYECFALMIDQKKWEKWAKTRLGFLKADTFKALVDPGPDLIICDEGHLLRNKQTQRTMALNKVKTRRRIVLTGTPLQNNLLEYYYMVHFVKPNLLGTEKEFKTNFVNPICNGQFEDSTADDIMIMKKRTHVLHKILNKTVQRVEDSELKQYLPNFTDQAVFVKLSDLQVHLYNAFLDMVNSRPVVYTKAGEVSRASFLGDIQILRYICQHPDVVLIAEKTWKLKIKEHDVIDDLDFVEEVRAFERNGWYKDLLPKAGTKKLEMGTKMMTVVNLVKEAAEIGDKVLIFAQAYAEMDNLEWFLSHHLNFKKHIDYSRMDGTIKAEHRAAMCKSFNSKKNSLKVFIMSTKVGGLGLNLTAANRVILMNVNWNPSYDIQSVFRVFRFGQTKPVYVYRLIAMDTMEEKMYQRQVTKLAIAHRVVDKHQITRHYSAADIQEFYSVRPTIHGDRPIPNVPEDRVLAKLLQKHQFIHRWHEHQALLANRPEEDLDEMQKNAAWEEFNRKPEPPPPFPVPVDNPNFLTATSVLAGQPGPWAPQIIPLGRYAGPSGTQPRVSVMPHRLPGTPGFFTRPPGQVFRPPGQVFGPPNLRPGPSGVYPVAPRPAHLGLQPVQSVVQSRPLGQLPVSSGQQPGPSDLNNRPGFVPVPQKLNAVRQNLTATHFPDHSYSLPKEKKSHNDSFEDFRPRLTLPKLITINGIRFCTTQQSSKIPAALSGNIAQIVRPATVVSQPRVNNIGNVAQNIRATAVQAQPPPSSRMNNIGNVAQNSRPITVVNPLSRINNSGNVAQNAKPITVVNPLSKTNDSGNVAQNAKPIPVVNQQPPSLKTNNTGNIPVVNQQPPSLKTNNTGNVAQNAKSAIVASQQPPQSKINNTGNVAQNAKPTIVTSQQPPSSKKNNAGNLAQNAKSTTVVNQQPHSSKANTTGNVAQNAAIQQPSTSRMNNSGKIVQSVKPIVVPKIPLQPKKIAKISGNAFNNSRSNQNVSVGGGVTLSLEKTANTPTPPQPPSVSITTPQINRRAQPSTANALQSIKKRQRESESPTPKGNLPALPAKRAKLDSSNNSTINLSHLSPPKNDGDSVAKRITDAVMKVKKKNGSNVKQATLSQTGQIKDSTNNKSLVQNVNAKLQKGKMQANKKSAGNNKSAENTILQRPENGHHSRPNKLKVTPFKKLPPGTKPPASAKIINVLPTKKVVRAQPLVRLSSDDCFDLTSPPASANQQQSPQMVQRVRSSLDHLHKLQELGKSNTSPNLKNDPKLTSTVLSLDQTGKASSTITQIVLPKQGLSGTPSTLNAVKNLSFLHTPQTTIAAASASASPSQISPNVRTYNGASVRAIPGSSKMNVNGMPVTVRHSPNGSLKVSQSGRQMEQQAVQHSPMRSAQGQPNANTLQKKITNNLNKIIQISPISRSPVASTPHSNTTKSNKKPASELVKTTSLPSLNQLPSSPAGFKSNKENRTKRKLSLKSNNNAEENQSPTSSSQEQLINDFKKNGFSISPIINHNPIKK